MEFNQYFSRAEKKNGNSSRSAFKYTPKWKTLLLFPTSPSNSISRPPRDSIHSRHIFPYIRTSGENGSEDGSTSGHSESSKFRGFNVQLQNKGCFGTIWSRRRPFSPEQNIKWNSISTSPKQKKERKLQSNSIQVYSKTENSHSPL
ncbi:hypothetical protein CEXT_288071 [Caerostris extrusa]|uniref:Uncharacterized protein n=1 Tax=Caerostris extrusa TaxID=172846 RepID=A0AAV4P468_CAEEX|nr:hypothetical protein CEXT_288071 [Caerostris extrusa]